MTIDHFRYLFRRELDVFYLTDNILLFKKPYSVWFADTDTGARFKSVDEMLMYKIGDKTIKQMIEELDKPFTPSIEGSRGSSSKSQGTFEFGHADQRGRGKNDKSLLPAQANVRIKNKSLEGALNEFKRKHLDSDHEWAYEVDSNGYVHQYVEGARSSVAIGAGAKVRRGEGTMIIHNHPSGGAFSDEDLYSFANQRNSKGFIASGKRYDYKIEKGTHFKAQQFTKAVRTAKMRGTDYDDAVNKWLKANQKKYGYRYSRTKN